jgi:hypothetical protein
VCPVQSGSRSQFAVAASGLVAHDLLSLPLAAFAPETVGPVLVYAGLFVRSADLEESEATLHRADGLTRTGDTGTAGRA